MLPVTTPVVLPIVAILNGEILQLPPPAASVSVSVWPVHACILPPITDGAAFTVTIAVDEQPAVEV